MQTSEFRKSTLAVVLLLAVGAVLQSKPTGLSQTPTSRPKDVTEEVVTVHSGVPLSLIGEYDVGLNKATLRKRKDVGEAVSRFLLNDRKRFGLSSDDEIRFEVGTVEVVGRDMVFAKVEQYVGDLRVVDSDLTIVLDDNGLLLSLNGRIVPNKAPQARASLNLERVIEVLEKDEKVRPIGKVDDFTSVARNEWRRKDGATLEAGWSRNFARPVWKAYFPQETILISDETGDILRRRPQLDPGPDSNTAKCKVRHRDWPRASDGRATTLSQGSNTTTSNITCGADEWWGVCYWHLKRQPFGFKHGIARIEDMDGAEQEWSQGCLASAMPSFTQTSNDELREQGAFYIANQMRYFMDKTVWSQVTPNRDSNVDIHMDHPDSPTADFNDFYTSIRASQAYGLHEALMHEYGHYVVWTYDDVSQNCVPGSDEGNSLDETLASVFGQLFALASPDIKPQYGALGIFGGGNLAGPHTTEGSLVTQNITCSGEPDYADGRAFRQAVWELLFNRNCSLGTCSGQSRHGNQIWIGESRAAVIQHVGAALGYALRALGTDITHAQVRAQMIKKIKNDSGRETADRAKAIFSHHAV